MGKYQTMLLMGSDPSGDVKEVAVSEAGALLMDFSSGASFAATQIGAGTVSNTEFGYLDGVTSALQTQIDAKVSTPASIANEDLLVRRGGAWIRLPVGSEGQVLKVVSGVIAWAADAT